MLAADWVLGYAQHMRPLLELPAVSDNLAAPFVHAVRRQCLEPHRFERLARAFPICPTSSGPTGHSLYWGDAAYEDLLRAEPDWRELFETFQSQQFIDWARFQFAQEWQLRGCRIALDQAHYVTYREDRVDKELPRLRRVVHEPHELWVRVDIHQGKVGYDRPIHREHARRLLSLLIYFSDPAQPGLEGGELRLHAAGWRRWFDPPLVIKPSANLLVAFPCSDVAFHSVASVSAAQRPRNFIQVQISSSVDVWPRGLPW